MKINLSLKSLLPHLFLWSLLTPPLGGWGVGGVGCVGVACSTINKSTFRTDSLAWTMRDSLSLSRSLQASVGQVVRLQQYTFSRPDSAGRQYVESATLLSATTDGIYTEQASGERKQTADLTETHALQAAEHRESGARSRRFPYWAVGVLAGGIIAFFVWKN